MIKMVLPNVMRTVSPANAVVANPVNAVPFAKSERVFVLLRDLADALKRNWPKKTEANVSYFTGVSERAVQFWLAASTRMSVEHVAALLRTDEGYEILNALMGDCQAEWWLTTKNAHELRKTRRQIAEAQKRIDAVKARQSQIDLFDQK